MDRRLWRRAQRIAESPLRSITLDELQGSNWAFILNEDFRLTHVCATMPAVSPALIQSLHMCKSARTACLYYVLDNDYCALDIIRRLLKENNETILGCDKRALSFRKMEYLCGALAMLCDGQKKYSEYRKAHAVVDSLLDKSYAEPLEKWDALLSAVAAALEQSGFFLSRGFNAKAFAAAIKKHKRSIKPS